MNDEKTMGSLAEKLMSYLSTAPRQDANYDIALAMLTHYGKLKNLSLAEIADLCYVSKASLSRFCRFMGFDSFRELHDCLRKDFSIGTDYSRTFFDKLCACLIRLYFSLVASPPRICLCALFLSRMMRTCSYKAGHSRGNRKVISLCTVDFEIPNRFAA